MSTDTSKRVINTKMFRRILSFIELNPQTFDMSDWIRNFSVDDVEEWDGAEYIVPEGVNMSMKLDLEFDSQDRLVSEVNVCGTTFCISGFALLLDGWTFRRDQTYPEKDGEEFDDWTTTGAKILGLSQSDADILFGETNRVAHHVVRQLAAGAEEIDWDAAWSAANFEIYG